MGGVESPATQLIQHSLPFHSPALSLFFLSLIQYHSITPMTATMNHGSFRRRDDPPEFNLREWDLQANRITRHNTSSRRFSASNINSFREDVTRRSSFRSNVTNISSTASSPGYTLIKDEIDPSTYSFTSALKALQAKSGFHYNYECLSPEGFALHSKWSDAEKYISNPHSGQVPMECLSARSFRNLQNRVTMSAPLVYNFAQPKLHSLTVRESDLLQNIPIEEKKEVGTTRDIGIQIGTPAGSSSSSSLSLASTPSIQDRAPKRYAMEEEGGDSSNSSSKPKSEIEVEMKQGNHHDKNKKESDDQKETSDLDSDDSSSDNHHRHRQHIRRCGPSAGCLSWITTVRNNNNKHDRRLTKLPPPSIKTTKKNSFSISFSSFKKRSETNE